MHHTNDRLLLGKRGRGKEVYGNSLYFLINFSINLKLLQKIKSINLKQKLKALLPLSHTEKIMSAIGQEIYSKRLKLQILVLPLTSCVTLDKL